jgi:osmotically-inducible protein OsmY
MRYPAARGTMAHAPRTGEEALDMIHRCTITRIISGIAIAIVLGPGAVLAANQGSTRDDDAIRRALYTEFVVNGQIPAGEIDVDVRDGIAELTGTVDSAAAHHEALRLAEAVRGVRGLVDRLEVRAPEVDDTVIAQHVTGLLLDDPVADFGTVVVESDAGVVTLRGTVDSNAEAVHAVDLARSVKGVREVVNAIAIETDADRSDADIAADVRTRLDDDAALSRRFVEVEVDDAVVRLDGTVGSLEEVRRARSLAWVLGVEDVVTEDLEVGVDRDLELRPAPTERSDRAIRSAIVDAFELDPRLQPPFPEIRVDNGAVTLRGEVDTIAQEEAAVEDAGLVAGAGPVHDLLEVTPPEVPDDDALRRAAETALEHDAWLHDDDVGVRVMSGRADLMGRVSTMNEWARAERVVGRIPGIAHVDNLLQVTNAPDEPYDDEELLAAVEDQLWWSTRVDARQVDVQVDGGVAHLYGRVDSWHERRAAEDEARQTDVAAVVNHIEVDGPGERPALEMQ